ncbi:hypothetical protein LPJ75_006895, partial [Coemansia sp. RSA 2598]
PGQQLLHPVAKAAQEAASVPVDQCVTITIPYTISSASLAAANDGGQQQTSSPLSNVAQLISDVQRVQQRHALLLSRLTEKLASTGWSIQYHHISAPTESIQIALPPSSGIHTAADLEALLCDWGFDMALFAATICDPVSPPPASKPAAAKNGIASHSMNSGTSAVTADSDDIDSRLFSLIVDEVVDPEEAYREEVRDFLAQIEQMPRLSRGNSSTSSKTKTSLAFARRSAGNNLLLSQQEQQQQPVYPFLM